jgi:hypothetical protein
MMGDDGLLFLLVVVIIVAVMMANNHTVIIDPCQDKTMCADGICRSSCLGICQPGTIYCQDHTCKATCPSCQTGFILCPDGTCRAVCDTPPPPIEYIPFAVQSSVGVDWFNTWARPNDMLVTFGDDFTNTPNPTVGKVAWNVPSFQHAIDMEPYWSGKIDSILYDYETWNKTPEDEKSNPDWASSRAQLFSTEHNLLLVQGSSWRMVTTPNGGWGAVKGTTVTSIAKNVDNFGLNAAELRRVDPSGFIQWMLSVNSYAVQANPDIKIWLMLDARNQTASDMYNMVQQLNTINIGGISFMGGDKDIISSFISMMRSG